MPRTLQAISRVLLIATILLAASAAGASSISSHGDREAGSAMIESLFELPGDEEPRGTMEEGNDGSGESDAANSDVSWTLASQRPSVCRPVIDPHLAWRSLAIATPPPQIW